jgi:AcrR family transcriptional regulator
MGRPRRNDDWAPLSSDLIADAALALVDREGLGALSMRRIGVALGVEAMALYHHFPNKEALLEGLRLYCKGAPRDRCPPSLEIGVQTWGRWRELLTGNYLLILHCSR